MQLGHEAYAPKFRAQAHDMLDHDFVVAMGDALAWSGKRDQYPRIAISAGGSRPYVVVRFAGLSGYVVKLRSAAHDDP